MAESIWTAGKLTAVYQPAGRFSDGTTRFRRAPIDLMIWASDSSSSGDMYINTLGFERLSSASIGLIDDDAEAPQAGHEFGYYSMQPLIVDVHDGNGQNDGWPAVHMLGYI